MTSGVVYITEEGVTCGFTPEAKGFFFVCCGRPQNWHKNTAG